MASRIQSQQHRQRMADLGVTLPPALLAEEVALLQGAGLERFRDEFAAFAKLGCSYAELEGLKQMTAALDELATAFEACSADAAAREAAAAAYTRAYGACAQLLLLPNSRPLHRQLLSALGRPPGALTERATEVLAWRLRAAAQRRLDDDHSLAEALVSVLATQPTHVLGCAALERAALDCARAEARSAAVAQAAASAGAPLAPTAAEGARSALGVLYSIIARHGAAQLAAPDAGEDAHAVLAEATDACLSCLQQPALSREAALTAAVALIAAACLRLDAQAAARVLAGALFPTPGGESAAEDCTLDALVLRPRGSSFAAECGGVTRFGRLALLKGALAAAPLEALLLPLRRAGTEGASASPWTLLLDGLLPELCGIAEHTSCAHERYHAIAGAGAAVRLLTQPAGAPGAALPPTLRARLLSVVWGGWEDPQPQVVRAVAALFEGVLAVADGTGKDGDGAAGALNAALTLLRSGPRKGRYAPLGALVRRCRASALLAAAPSLLRDTLLACGDETVCAAATGFMRTLSEDYHTELVARNGAPAAQATVEALWLPPLLGALAADGRVRTHCGSHLLPALFALHPFLAAALLRALGGKDAPAVPPEEPEEDVARLSLVDESGDDSTVAASVVTVLRAGRGAGLSSPGGAHALLVAPDADVAVAVPERMLRAVAGHARPDVRTDALQLLCCSPRDTELPGGAEARALRVALALAQRGGGGAAARNRTASLLRRLLPRLAAGLDRSAAIVAAGPGGAPQRRRNGKATGRSAATRDALACDPARLAAARALPPWLLRTALRGAYPGAPFERKFAAVDTVAAVAETWPPAHASAALAAGADAWPYDAAALSPGWLGAILAAGVDSWDLVRLRVASLLQRHAAPLPGLATPQALAPLVAWAVRLCRSPRVRESDAAALLLRTLAALYVVRLRWSLPLHAGSVPSPPPPGAPLPSAAAAAAAHLEALVDAVEADAVAAEADMVAAAKHALAHGSLLALRYALPELRLETPELAAEPSADARTAAALARLMALLARLTQLALTAVARPEAIGASAADVATDAPSALPPGGVGLGTYFGNDDADGDSADSDGSEDDDEAEDASGDAVGDGVAGLTPHAQMVMTAAWLTMKEVALCAGALAERTPARLLPLAALADAGAMLVDVLLVTKHNGAVDKARQGLTQVAARLLREPHGGAEGEGQAACPARAPAAWAATLLTRLEDRSQGVRDLIRRSAGLPAALLALCCAEPAGVQRSLLPLVLHRALSAANAAAALPASDASYVPGVHGFNVMRVLFSDRTLGAETAGALADGVAATLAGFASPHWAVRNGAGMAFAALCVRVTGALNAPPRPAAGSAASLTSLTAPQFFARFPPLHAALLAALDDAADAARRGELHPALQPTLALLARLRAAPVEPQAGARGNAPAALDAAPFLPRVHTAGGARHAYVRALAARALVPLVPPTDAPAAAAQRVASLPCGSPAEQPAAWAQYVGGFNAVHGALLQAAALVRSALDTSPAPAVAAAALLRCGLVAALLRCDWLADPARCGPPMVRAQFCDTLCALTEATGAADGTAGEDAAAARDTQAALWGLIQRAADMGTSAGGGGPGEALWRKRCALLAAAAALRDGTAGDAAAATAALLPRLRSAAYEVRGAVLKTLQRALAAQGRLTLDVPSLRAGVATALTAETHHKCIARMLELLAALPPPCDDAEAAVAPSWQQLDAATADARDGRQRAAALRCLGAAVAHAPAHTRADAAAAMLRHADAASLYAATPEMRAAAAHALAASGLLHADALQNAAEAGGGAPLALRGWLLVLRLLEDEDEDARGLAAAAVSAALRCGGGSSAEAALPAAVAHVARAFAHAPLLHAWLLSAVVGPPPAAALRRGASLARRLFDREVENHHAEALLTAQLAARELTHAPLPAATLAAAAAALGAAAADAAPLMARLHARSAWAGGVTNHADAFLPCYRTLLAAWVLAPAIAAQASASADAAAASAALAAGTAALGDELLRMAPHPLLRDMLLTAADALAAAGFTPQLSADALATARAQAEADFDPLYLL